MSAPIRCGTGTRSKLSVSGTSRRPASTNRPRSASQKRALTARISGRLYIGRLTVGVTVPPRSLLSYDAPDRHLAAIPALQRQLAERDEAVQGKADTAEQDDGGEHGRGLAGRGGEHDDIAEPGLGGDELADDDADHRHRHADLHAGKDKRHRIGEPRQAKHL